MSSIIFIHIVYPYLMCFDVLWSFMLLNRIIILFLGDGFVIVNFWTI